ncbi:MAG: hypothetical protein D6758_00400 [Gammaproteobacteria bacterium]|nr:MAG: hypothetical protein D6758_00400 [Gammaproteobacteria bacterium]
MDIGTRTLTALGLLLSLAACSDDGAPPEAPKAAAPEPKEQITLTVADFPAVDYGYFQLTSDSGNKTLFQLEYATNNLTPLNKSTNAQFYRPVLNLGEGRSTSAWAFMEDGGRLYRLDPVTETPAQMSTFSNTVCDNGLSGYQTAVGLAGLQIVLRLPGTDATCGTPDDSYVQVAGDAAPTDTPAASSAHRFSGMPLNTTDGSLAGFAVTSGASVVFYNAAGDQTASLSGTSGQLNIFLRQDGHFWLVLDSVVYDVPPELVTNNQGTATIVDTLSATPTALAQDGETLLALDGTQLILLDESGNVNTLADVSASLDTPQTIAATSAAYVYLYGQNGGQDSLVAIDRSSGTLYTVASQDARSDVAALNGRLFYNTHDGSDFTAHVWAETSQTDASLATARWVSIQTLGEGGTDTALLLHQLVDPNADGDNDPYSGQSYRALMWMDPVTVDITASDLAPYTYATYGSTSTVSEVVEVDLSNKERLLLEVKSTTATDRQTVYQLNRLAANSLKSTQVSITPGQGSLDFR